MFMCPFSEPKYWIASLELNEYLSGGLLASFLHLYLYFSEVHSCLFTDGCQKLVQSQGITRV